jgi:Circadian oscillating protein COP23
MMNNKLFSVIAVSTGLAISGIGFNSELVKAQEQVKFVCAPSFDQQTNQKLPTTFAWTSRGKIAVVRWETNAFKNYSPETRCQQVSPRFQEAYDNGGINFLTNGQINQQPVICTARESGAECATLLMTLRPEDNPVTVLTQLQEVLNGRQVGAVRHSSNVPQLYYQVDFENFLRTAPVESE